MKPLTVVDGFHKLLDVVDDVRDRVVFVDVDFFGYDGSQKGFRHRIVVLVKKLRNRQ